MGSCTNGSIARRSPIVVRAVAHRLSTTVATWPSSPCGRHRQSAFATLPAADIRGAASDGTPLTAPCDHGLWRPARHASPPHGLAAPRRSPRRLRHVICAKPGTKPSARSCLTPVGKRHGTTLVDAGGKAGLMTSSASRCEWERPAPPRATAPPTCSVAHPATDREGHIATIHASTCRSVEVRVVEASGCKRPRG